MARRHVHLLIAASLALVSPACTAPDTAPTGDAPTSTTTESGVEHIHGVDLNLDDGSVYAATHHGLYRVEAGRPVRVTQHLQDTMGLTITGPIDSSSAGIRIPATLGRRTWAWSPAMTAETPGTRWA